CKNLLTGKVSKESRSPSTDYRLPTTEYRLSTDYRVPTTEYRVRRSFVDDRLTAPPTSPTPSPDNTPRGSPRTTGPPARGRARPSGTCRCRDRIPNRARRRGRRE